MKIDRSLGSKRLSKKLVTNFLLDSFNFVKEKKIKLKASKTSIFKNPLLFDMKEAKLHKVQLRCENFYHSTFRWKNFFQQLYEQGTTM